MCYVGKHILCYFLFFLKCWFRCLDCSALMLYSQNKVCQIQEVRCFFGCQLPDLHNSFSEFGANTKQPQTCADVLHNVHNVISG